MGEGVLNSEIMDEVILCLNYDGKFGLNSMNQYFQNANTKSEAFTWAEWIFKIGDRIIFLDTRRSSLLYNNLKGVIEDIIKTMSSIVFTININTYLTEEQCRKPCETDRVPWKYRSWLP